MAENDAIEGMYGVDLAPEIATQVANPSSIVGSALRAAFAARHRTGFGGRPLWAFGTSYEAPGSGYVEDLAAALGSTVVNNAATGGSNAPALPYQYVDSPQKWVPGTSAGDVLIGSVGDALSESTDPAVWKQSREVYGNAIQTALRWVRARAVRDMQHATVTLNGAQPQNFNVSAVSVVNGASIVTGQSITITLNEAVDPGEIVLITVPWRNSAASENGDFRYRVDGGPWRAGTTVGKGDSRPDGSNVIVTLRSHRITGVAKNSVIEIQQVAGKVLFRNYLLMDNPTPPSVMLMMPVPLVEVGGVWDFPGGEISENPNKNNASQEKYRDILRRIAVAPEFADGTVVVADPAPIWNAATDLNADQIHPNDTTGRVAHVTAALAAAQTVGR